MKKRVLAALMAIGLLTVSLSACGGAASENNIAGENPGTSSGVSEEEKNEEAPAESAPSEAFSGNISADTVATLKLAGPGIFTEVGENGSVDLITGVQRPGYKEVIQRWNELYPNISVEIETAPWDNWMAYLETAALSGEVDILLHGASITAASLPLDKYLEKNPELLDQCAMMAVRKNDKDGSYKDFITYGVSITTAPVMAVIDTKILEDYGVEIPDKTWTFEDMKNIAKACTGKNPVTGKQTYGMSMLPASGMERNYIWAARGLNSIVFDYADTVKDTKVNFDTDKSREVLSYLEELYKCSSPDYIEELDLVNKYTADNDIAIIIDDHPYNDYDQIKMNGQEDHYILMQLPAIEGGKYDGISASHLGDWNMAISRTSKQPDIAWEFLKFMATDEVVQQWLVDCKYTPNNKKGSELLANVMPESFYKPIQEVLDTYDPMFSLQANDSYNNIDFGGFWMNVQLDINEIGQGNMTVDEACKDVQAKLDEFFGSLG